MEYLRLKDVCDINMGQSPTSDSYNDDGDGVPFFQGNADFGDRYPVTRKWCNAPTKMAQPDDILISVRAPIGAINYAKEECCIGRGLAAVTPDRDKVSPDFVFWFLKGKKEELNSKGTGSTFKAISRKVLEEILVPNVDLKEQSKYAEILEKIYFVQKLQKQELKYLDDLIKARFVEMFGSVHENKFPKCMLRDVAHIKHGYAFNGKFFSEEDNGVVLVTPGNFALGGGFQEVRNKYFTSEYPDEYILHAGDLIVTMTDLSKKADTLGYGAIVPDTGKIYLHNQRIGLFDKLDDRFNPIFVRWYMQTDEYRLEIVRTSTGSTVHHTSPDRILNSIIFIPPIELQNEYVSFVRQTDKSKSARNRRYFIVNKRDEIYNSIEK